MDSGFNAAQQCVVLQFNYRDSSHSANFFLGEQNIHTIHTKLGIQGQIYRGSSNSAAADSNSAVSL